MTITITINTSHAAFGDDKDEEVIRILDTVMQHVHQNGCVMNQRCRDINGNTVGSVTVTGS